MHVPDVNALVYAHRGDMPQHQRYRAWLDELLNGPSPYGVVDVVTLGFLRTVTNHRIFHEPTPLDEALRFVGVFRGRRHAVEVLPGPRHWVLFDELCRRVGALHGNATDAYLASLAVEHGHELVTEDGGVERFPELRTFKPPPP